MGPGPTAPPLRRSRTRWSTSPAGCWPSTAGARSGVAAAGFVDRDAQRVRFAPHLPWRDEPLSKRLTHGSAGRIQGDVLVDNDATAALWAEGRFGAARDGPRRRDDHARHRHRRRADASTARCTGAATGWPASSGTCRWSPTGARASAGGEGCWEQYCSGRALARAAEEAGSDLVRPGPDDGGLRGRPGRHGGVRAGGALARASASANLVAAFDPPARRRRRRRLRGRRPAARARPASAMAEQPRRRRATATCRSCRRRARSAGRRGRRGRPGPDGRPDQARR